MALRWFWAVCCSLILGIFSCGEAFATQLPNFNNPLVHKYNYGIIGLFGQGKMGNNSFAAPPRNMDFTTYQLFFGFRVNNYRYSIVGEASYVAQKTPSEDVSNTNIGGLSYAYGPKFEYYNGKHSFGIIYRAKSTYRLNKLDSNNNRQYYGSKTGFNIQYTHRVKEKWGIVFDYAREEYGQSLSENVKWDRMSVGFIFSNFDKSPFPLPDAK